MLKSVRITLIPSNQCIGENVPVPPVSIIRYKMEKTCNLHKQLKLRD